MQDLQGLKIRTGPLANGVAVDLRAGQTFRITTRQVVGSSEEVSTTYPQLPDDVRPGDTLLLSDGLIELGVRAVAADTVVTEVVHGGALRAH